MADTLQRRAVVRRAQKHQPLELRRPRVSGLRGLVKGTARQQAAHAVPQQRQFLHRLRPGREQLLQQSGQLRAIGRNVQAAVVVQVHRGVAEFAGQHQAVVVRGMQRAVSAMGAPLQVVHAQAVNQHQQLGRSGGQALRQRGFFQRQGLAFVAQAHVDGQRIGGVLQLVAEHAVERRQHRFALAG